MDKNPTVKQKKATAAIINGDASNIGEAMKKAGYSPRTALTPKKLTESKGYRALMKKYLPDSLLAKKHQALLNKVETIEEVSPTTGKRVKRKTQEIDTFAVSKGLDMAYKIKGEYQEKVDVTSGGEKVEITQIVINRPNGNTKDSGN